MDKRKLSKENCNNRDGFSQEKVERRGGLHVSRDSSVRKRNSPGPRSFSQGPKFWCEIKIGIKSTMKPGSIQTAVEREGDNGQQKETAYLGQSETGRVWYWPGVLVLNDLGLFACPVLMQIVFENLTKR